MFWFKPQALKTLIEYNWEYTDFPIEPNAFDGTILHGIESIYGFVVQHEGYYPAWLMSVTLFRNLGHHYGHIQLINSIHGRTTVKSIIKQKIKSILEKISILYFKIAKKI